MTQTLNDTDFDLLFLNARTHNGFSGSIDDETIHKLYNLVKFGPTEANTTPARFVFVKHQEGKEKLLPLMSESNRQKTADAPVSVIIGYDMHFYDKLPMLFPHTDAKSWFDTRPEEALEKVAMRNSSLQAGYLIMAARALGLDCGPMTGFDAAAVDAAFFAGTHIRSNMIINLGKGDHSKVFPRLPRLSFDEAARIE